MADRETVITHLQIIHIWASFAREHDLQFFTAKHLEDIAKWADDAIAMLKEHEAVWNVLHDLCELGYPHNFQREAPWVVDYLYELTEIIKKAFMAKEGR